jgi:hypothetical protein
MNICDVDLWFEIYNYKKPTKETADYDWCNTSFSLKSKYIDYNIDGWEVFLNDEIDYMKSAFKDLLEGNIKEECTVSFAEPDFEFDMSPIKTLYSEPGKVWYKNGSVTLDISNPVSTIVVDTSTSISPFIKSYIICSSFRSLICPWAKATLASGTRAAIRLVISSILLTRL